MELEIVNEPKKLKIDNKLPQIIIPKEKVKLFIEWFLKDLWRENELPMVFQEGYISTELSDIIKIKTLSVLELNEKSFGVQNILISEIQKNYSRIIIHYKIYNKKEVILSIYSEATGERVCNMKKFDISLIKSYALIKQTRDIIANKSENCNTDLVVDIPKMKQESDEVKNLTDMLRSFNEGWAYSCVFILISSFWYLASIQNSKEETYVGNKNNNKITKGNTEKNTRKDTGRIKNLTNSIYDFSIIKSTNVNKLIAKKKGWKISCEFQVRGHYRHYKSGKVVFIKPFEKGKGLENKSTILKLLPNEEKRS